MTKNLVHAELELTYEEDEKEWRIYVNIMRCVKNKYEKLVFDDTDEMLNPKYYDDIWDVYMEYEDDNVSDKARGSCTWENVIHLVFCELEWKRIEKITAWEFNGEKG